jgi:hypothetical protein
MGYIADKRSLQMAFIAPIVAMMISSVILFYGMRFAPEVGFADHPDALPVRAG